ncbi:trypsin-4 [Nilaparvata lugens]|uniref:trypsin-4 n=1 Tax=Nilaparvata lugens TaxID=108931 RepID=UPI00193DC4FC|nr:trypsin-4 [Nilaparvata lugens]
MVIRFILCLCFIISVFALPPNDSSGSEERDASDYLGTIENAEDSSRIFHGKKSNIKNHSYTLALLTKSKDLIGGAVLIKKNWAITAAWNVNKVKPSDLVIKSYSNNCLKNGHTSYVTKIIVHDNYNGWESNVALLKIGKNKMKKEKTIEIGNSLPEEGSNVTIIGWGSEDGEKKSDGIAREGEAEFLSYGSCSAYYSPQENFSNSSFCTKNSESFGPCYMDYGSPVVYDKYLVGLFSGSLSCSDPKYPAVHVDLTQYKDWVEKKTR